MLVSRFFIIIIIILISPFQSFADNQDQKKIVRIAAGSILEGYYFIGLKLCKYISKANDSIGCDVVPTTGTIENLKLLRERKVDFAFAQSNLALDAYNGDGYFTNSDPFRDIIQVLRLHNEAFTVIVKDKDKILKFSELDGKKISNGPNSSDSSLMYQELISNYNFKKQPEDIELFHEEYAKEFCAGNIDAIILMTGHPNALVSYITHACESDFLTIEKDKLDAIVNSNLAFTKYTIHAKGYPGITKSEKTIAAPAILVSDSSVPKQIITNFLNYFDKKVKSFKDSDPLLHNLDVDHFTSGFVLQRF